MKSIVAILFSLLLPVGELAAQSGSTLSGPVGSVRVSPLFQIWSQENDSSLSEFSSVISVQVPLNREAAVYLRSAHGSVSGDAAEIDGFTDSQLGGTYKLEDLGLVIGLGLNIPSGKTKLADSTFLTTAAISNPVLLFQVPGFGQGFNVSPSVVWARELSEQVVAGLGASFQYKGGFAPLADGVQYEPGSEIALTAGVDIRTGEASSLSGDLVFTMYGTDRFDGREYYAAGSRVMLGLQYRAAFENNELWTYVRLRSRGKSELATAAGLTVETQKTDPNQMEFGGWYRVRLNDRFSNTFLLDVRLFEETRAALSGLILFSGGFAPELLISRNVTVPMRLRLHFGALPGDRSLIGLEAGLGLSVTF